MVKKTTKSIKERILRDITNLSEHSKSDNV